ncbi:hypothetical protein Tco_1491861 [Tanacetum coccineum]
MGTRYPRSDVIVTMPPRARTLWLSVVDHRRSMRIESSTRTPQLNKRRRQTGLSFIYRHEVGSTPTVHRLPFYSPYGKWMADRQHYRSVGSDPLCLLSRRSSPFDPPCVLCLESSHHSTLVSEFTRQNRNKSNTSNLQLGLV